MKKTGLAILIALTVLALSGVATEMSILAVQQAKDKPVVLRSPVINGGGELAPGPHYVYSDSPVLKTLLGVNHEFPGKFSTELSSIQLGSLKLLGIKTEPVGLYHIVVPGPPVCGDGEAHPSEECGEPDLPECPEGEVCEDCRCVAEEGPCYPDNQYPWGIMKVNGGTGGADITVAVLDTGVDQDHPDLQANIIDCLSKVTHFPPDTKSCEDAHGHGTHVAGTVAAFGDWDKDGVVEPGEGIVGVAPEANLMIIKVCDRRGSCYTDDISAAIYYAADHGANVISMSLGGDYPYPDILEAVDYAESKGVLSIAAAGNSGPEEDSMIYPGAYYKVMGIAALQQAEGHDPVWIAGKYDSGLEFTGSDPDFVSVPDDPSLDLSGELTIEAWINASSLSNNENFVVSKYDWMEYGYAFQVLGDGTLRLKLYDTEGNEYLTSSPANAISAGEWYHVAGTYDGSVIKLYVNGNEVASSTQSFTIGTGDLSLSIGSASDRISDANYGFSGVIDEVRLSNIARTSFDLASAPTLDANTVALWHLDEGSGTTAYDETGVNDGSLGIPDGVLVADFSSRGLSNGDDVVDEGELDLATPGVDIESTANDGCYTYMSGTSMATPHASGLAAKLWQGSASKTRTYLDFEVIKDLYTAGHDIYTGFGLPVAP